MSGSSSASLPGLFARNAAEAPALILPSGESLTFGKVADLAARFAGGLHDLDVRRGDFVALWLTNVPEWLIACLGAMQLGAGVISINTRSRAREVGNLLRRRREKGLASTVWQGKLDASGILASLD